MQSIYQKTGSVYVLKCMASKYYVGYTEKAVESRIKEHYNGEGSEWTRIYKPIETVDSFHGDLFDEDSTTKRYMSKYGIENVRGGSYCQITIPSDKLKVLETELRSGNNKCFMCGNTGHYSNKCHKKILCARCGRNTHIEEKCYAKTHLDGTLLNDKHVEDKHVSSLNDDSTTVSIVSPVSTGNQQMLSDDSKCTKCGRARHYGNICLYAKFSFLKKWF